MKAKILFIILIFLANLPVRGIGSTPDNYIIKAKEWASTQYNGQIDVGFPYYAPDQTISAWAFNVYRKADNFPSKEAILSTVKYFYELRIQAEATGQNQLANEYFNAMRNDAEFATIFLTGSPSNPFVAFSYSGLPPHYLCVYDAAKKAIDYLKNDFSEIKYYYLDPINIYSEYKTEDKKAFVNLLFLENDIAVDIKLEQNDKTPTLQKSPYSENLW